MAGYFAIQLRLGDEDVEILDSFRLAQEVAPTRSAAATYLFKRALQATAAKNAPAKKPRADAERAA